MTRQSHLVVSIHDVAPPFFDRVRRIVDALADIGVHRLIALLPQDSEARALDTVAELGALSHR